MLELQADQPAQPARALPAVVQEQQLAAAQERRLAAAREQQLAAAQEQQVVPLRRVELPEAAPAVRTER